MFILTSEYFWYHKVLRIEKQHLSKEYKNLFLMPQMFAGFNRQTFTVCVLKCLLLGYQ